MFRNDMVMDVAKAIARSKGHDPEQHVVPGHPYQIDGKMFTSTSGFAEPFPLWYFYKIEATAAIDAVAKFLSPQDDAK